MSVISKQSQKYQIHFNIRYLRSSLWTYDFTRAVDYEFENLTYHI